MRKIAVIALLLLFSGPGAAPSAEKDVFEIETEGSCQTVAGTLPELTQKVALFNAKRTAVDLAGRYLLHKNLIKPYELKKDEIYSLAARVISAEVLEETWETRDRVSTCRLRIRTRVAAADFTRAEIEDIKQQRKESDASYQEEMEQPVTSKIDPGLDIAKAYRLLRKKKWRLAMIYLDHLEKKYPYWDSVYLAKAVTYYILHEPVFMNTALQKACRLGSDTACSDLKNIKKLQEHDFGLSVVE